jgi:Pyruvate/2-oxoacid:ferredoxin oxidoreductase delta subunit
MALEEKRQQIIGKAYIDQDRCLAWSDHIDCIVCEEMCPLPEKAIYLEESPITTESGSDRLIKLPHVQRDRCIGCGICEYKCPLMGKAAIQVWIS